VVFSAGGRSLTAQVFIARDAAMKPAPGGPLILYFHSIGTTADEVTSGFGQAAIDDVVRQGGVVASFESSLCLTCDPRQDVVIWYAEDDPVSDQLVACALQQAKIDTRRIHAVGFSAGGMHSVHLALARSDYVASIVSYSGGLAEKGTPQAPDNHVAALLAYGREGVDNVVLDFNQQSLQWYDTYQPRGYYCLMCDHQGGHELPSALVPHVYKFLLDHPYKVSPEPYAAMVPSEFPAYCRNKPANR
jgi:pimeloyl-ACP methyl ester carboxylesterase